VNIHDFQAFFSNPFTISSNSVYCQLKYLRK